MPCYTWRRTQLVCPNLPTRADDWSLVNAEGDQIAHLWNTQEPDIIGSWRWRIWIDHKRHEGSAHSGTEARETCQRLLAKNDVIER